MFDLINQDIGRPIGTFSNRIRHDALVDELRQVRDSGRPLECDVRDNDNRCYFLRILPYRVRDKVNGVVLSLIDISVLDEAREDVSRLSAIVESSDDAIISKNLDGIIQSWNTGAERLYGYTAEEAIGKHISLIIPDDQAAVAQSWMGRLKNGERIDPVETQRLTRDGRLVDVSVKISPVKESSGEIIGASAIARDITELQRTRGEKAAGDERIRLLLESTAEAIYGLDIEGRCTFVNPACVQLLGYDSADELLGQKMHEVIRHPRADGSIPPESECPLCVACRQGSPFIATVKCCVGRRRLFSRRDLVAPHGRPAGTGRIGCHVPGHFGTQGSPAEASDGSPAPRAIPGNAVPRIAKSA